jgi:hypothetical protein
MLVWMEPYEWRFNEQGNSGAKAQSIAAVTRFDITLLAKYGYFEMASSTLLENREVQ